MTDLELHCLRCSTLMVRGRVCSDDIARPLFWILDKSVVVILLGFLQKDATTRMHRENNARINASRALVKAYRCPHCGYVELNAQRDEE